MRNKRRKFRQLNLSYFNLVDPPKVENKKKYIIPKQPIYCKQLKLDEFFKMQEVIS